MTARHYARGLETEPVRDPHDRRRIVYWRYRREGQSIGAVARGGTTEPWRAIGYRPRAHAVELGEHPTRALAEKAVRAWHPTTTTTQEEGPR